MAKYSKLKRIYCKQNLISNESIEITDAKFSHLKNVLRLRVGEEFRIFNDVNGEYFAEIVAITRNSMQCQIKSQFRQAEVPDDFILALGVIKQDKFIEAIRGAAQLGVTKIIPIVMDNSQNNHANIINRDRIEKCIIETCEQCESMIIPSLAPEISFDQLLVNIENSWLFFADEKATITNNLPKQTIHNTKLNPMVLIGPEGGFSDKEREKLLTCNNITQMSLGQNVLRSEIATIATISLVQHMRRGLE